ncbi:ribonuclease H [[Candida] railenensis]|uniref:Ribonuclease H n=1 Tax=[Candida] railenensis TaxID=45579 RepID=A0A9P0QU81_9ASCO|nr:ribonuclease H [[Candida] railenensis]
MPYYAVQNGRSKGVYNTWNACNEQVSGYRGAIYKKFSTASEANAFVRGKDGYNSVSTPTNRSSTNSISKPKSSSSRAIKSSMPSRYYSVSSTQSPFIGKSEPVTGSTTPGLHPGGLYLSPLVSSSSGSHKVDSAIANTEPVLKEIYVDGASRGNGKHTRPFSGYGVYYGPNDDRNAGVPMSAVDDIPATNQRAELAAMLHALKDVALADSNEKFTIKSDSQYSIKAIREWSRNWESNGWKSSTGKPVQNKDLIEQCLKWDKIISKKYSEKGWGSLVIEHVRGHQGIEGNEAADRLANIGADKDEASRRN